MRAPPLWLVITIAVGVYLALRSRSTIPVEMQPLPSGGYTPVPPTFRPEWSGSDLYRETGAALPSGAARVLIR